MILTPPKISAYHRDGYLVLRGVFEESILKRIEQGLVRVVCEGKVVGHAEPIGRRRRCTR